MHSRAVFRVAAPLAAIVLFVIVANSVYLLVTNPNPLLQRSGLATTQGPHVPSAGLNTIDPNDGFTTQTLGTAAARQLLHGMLPLWNHYEGVGQPLAGGMQSAALFPFTLLLMLPGGVLIFHMVLEALAGIGMYLLLRRLRISAGPALVGGILFTVVGTFALLANAVVNPVAFLPWVILGIELARCSERWLRPRGWWLVCFAVWLALCSGFPETAFLYLLFAAGWMLARLPGTKRPAIYVSCVAAGVVLGAVLASPALVAFLDYLPYAWVGGHSGSFAGVSLPKAGLLTLTLPYIFGAITAWNGDDPSGTIAGLWANVGGYVTVGTLVLAVYGVIARRGQRALQAFLAIWVVVAVCRIYGVPVIGRLIDFVPGVSATAAYRYLPPALSAAAIVLAAMGLEALRTAAISRRTRVIASLFAAIVVLGVVAAAALTARHLAPGAAGLRAQVLTWGGLGIAVVLVIAVSAVLSGARRGWFAAGAIAVVEAAVLFIAPQFHAPTRPVTVDAGPVTYLQQNLGLGRFFTLGPIQPNYGSYFGIASVNDNNLPVPKSWQVFLQTKLIPTESPVDFDGVSPSNAQVSPKEQFLANLSNFESIGVEYVVEPEDLITDAEREQHRLVVAYDDGRTQILRLPSSAAYFQASSQCSVTPHGRDATAVECSAAGTVTRLEQYLPGWEARVDGGRVPVAEDGLFQRVAVPAGHHTLTFRFWPRNLSLALVAAGVAGLLVLVLAAGTPLYDRRRTSVSAPPDATTGS